jgi:hypothetical protein
LRLSASGGSASRFDGFLSAQTEFAIAESCALGTTEEGGRS